jgi:hypothetical protein
LSRDVPHEKIVEECLEALHGLLSTGEVNTARHGMGTAP